jgi:hypothetical protein
VSLAGISAYSETVPLNELSPYDGKWDCPSQAGAIISGWEPNYSSMIMTSLEPAGPHRTRPEITINQTRVWPGLLTYAYFLPLTFVPSLFKPKTPKDRAGDVWSHLSSTLKKFLSWFSPLPFPFVFGGKWPALIYWDFLGPAPLLSLGLWWQFVPLTHLKLRQSPCLCLTSSRSFWWDTVESFSL